MWAFDRLIGRLSGNYNEKQINKLLPIVDEINKCSDNMDERSDEDIKERSLELKSIISQIDLPKKIKDKEGKLVLESESSPLDEYLVEAYALVKQATIRLKGTSYTVKWEETIWHMIPYDVQILWAINLHQWKISEMKTWEGKTLVATMPAYLNALTWRGVHVITVNDYLASRDAEQMGIIYEFLGLSVGCVTKSTPHENRREEYAKDITYVENSEIWFDYLRDNLVRSLDQRSLLWRPLHYSIVDEVDSILIDESRTPLIISEPDSEPTDKYVYYAKIVQQLQASKHKKKVSKWFLADFLDKTKTPDLNNNEEDTGDYYIDEKLKTATLSSRGIEKLEKILWVDNIYKDMWYDEIHHIENALKANACYINGKEYIIKDWEVVIVDENTGRAQPWRRFSQWLHQAIEAKEWVEIQRESKTLATITYQNFFGLYYKLSGMTGTATTEWEEFDSIYNLNVLAIPTNKPVIRVDKNDKVFFNQTAKWNALIDQIAFSHHIGQPLLIGTSSIATSEFVWKLLAERNIKHSVLNAKHHEKEANIVARAGQLWSVVVATNMAWRGTDIKLQDNLNDQLALNYAKRAEQMLSGNNTNQTSYALRLTLYSEIEYELTIEALKNNFSDLNDELIRTSYKSKQYFGDYIITINFNNKKKTAEDYYAEIILSSDNATIKNTIQRNIYYGLGIIGTEKHESRRIDNQLRGRAGRQGDPGFSVFYVALDDTIMRKMWGEKIQSMASLLLGKNELEKIELTQNQFTKAIRRAQTQIEWRHFSTRKHLFDYDSVIDKQRQTIYRRRDTILQLLHDIFRVYDISNEDKSKKVKGFIAQIKNLITGSVSWFLLTQELLESNPQDVIDQINWEYGLKLELNDMKEWNYTNSTQIIIDAINQEFEQAKELLWEEIFLRVCANLYLSVIDKNRVRHIDEMQYLREKVGLVGYAQLDPLVVYKQESYNKYEILKKTIEQETISSIANTDFWQIADNLQAQREQLQANQQLQQNRNVLNKLKSAAANQTLQKRADKGIEIIETDRTPSTSSKITGKIRPNDRINIRYNDWKILYDVKYKKIKADIESGKAEVI